MASRILYFTAGAVPTVDETNEIATVTGLVAPFELHIRNGNVDPLTGGGEIEAADYVIGTIPVAYSDDEEYPVFDPDAPPDTYLPATQAIVVNGATVNVENSAGALDSPATAAVAANEVTNVRLAATKTIVTHGQVVAAVGSGAGTTATFSVAGGVITGVVLS